jgi:hypothetical protein
MERWGVRGMREGEESSDSPSPWLIVLLLSWFLGICGTRIREEKRRFYRRSKRALHGFMVIYGFATERLQFGGKRNIASVSVVRNWQLSIKEKECRKIKS